MISGKPILHISIYYRGSSKSKAELKKPLSTYAKRLLSNNTYYFSKIPTVDIVCKV